jgi:hypothetical protein
VNARSEIDRFYDGPAPEDADAAFACGGFAILARLRARQAGRHCDEAARSILARRGRLRLDRCRHGGDPDRDRAWAALLATFRAAGLAARKAATPETRGEI